MLEEEKSTSFKKYNNQRKILDVVDKFLQGTYQSTKEELFKEFNIKNDEKSEFEPEQNNGQVAHKLEYPTQKPLPKPVANSGFWASYGTYLTYAGYGVVGIGAGALLGYGIYQIIETKKENDRCKEFHNAPITSEDTTSDNSYSYRIDFRPEKDFNRESWYVYLNGGGFIDTKLESTGRRFHLMCGVLTLNITGIKFPTLLSLVFYSGEKGSTMNEKIKGISPSFQDNYTEDTNKFPVSIPKNGGMQKKDLGELTVRITAQPKTNK